MARQYVEDCGADKGFPKNPYLQIFTNYINHQPNLQAVVYNHTGTFADDKNVSLIYNDYRFIYSLEFDDKGKFYLGQRRKDIELYRAFSKREIQCRRAANNPDLPCPKEWDDLLSAALDPTIRIPSPEQPVSPKSPQSSDSAQMDNKALRALDIPNQLKNSPIEAKPPQMMSTEIATAMQAAFSFTPRPCANSGSGRVQWGGGGGPPGSGGGPLGGGGNPGGNPGGGGPGGPGPPLPGEFLVGGGNHTRMAGALPLIFTGDRTKAAKHWKLPKKLWAHSNSAAASTIKIMGPSNPIGRTLLAELLPGPFNTIGKGSRKCLAALSAILAILFGSMVQYYLQHLSVASLGPFNNIGNFFWLHLWAYTLPLAVISHYHCWAHPIILRKFLSGPIHNIQQF